MRDTGTVEKYGSYTSSMPVVKLHVRMDFNVALLQCLSREFVGKVERLTKIVLEERGSVTWQFLSAAGFVPR